MSNQTTVETSHEQEASFPSLEEECPRCNGRWPGYLCEWCDGLHYIPTAFGQEVLAFIRRHGFVQARER